MLRHLSICAALLTFAAAGSADAQQREAILKKVEAPGAAFDIILAMPKPNGVIFNFAMSPEALLVHLIGGELALGFESGEEMLKALESLRQPVCAFHAEGTDSTSRTPLAVYIVPKQ